MWRSSIAHTRCAVQALDTSHPPSYHIHPDEIAPRVLRRASGSSLREWKGAAVYGGVVVDGAVLPHVGWSYPNATRGLLALKDHVASYASPFELCSVDGETVIPLPGEFYSGWFTSKVAGPFKGGPGSRGW